MISHRELLQIIDGETPTVSIDLPTEMTQVSRNA